MAEYVKVSSLLGPKGPAPELETGDTVQVPAGEQAELSLTEVGEGRYRVDAAIPEGPRGPKGDPGSIANLPTEMASQITTPGEVQTALNAQSARSRGVLAAESYGVGPGRTGAQNRDQLQECVDDAGAAGLDVQLPGASFNIAGRVNINHPDVRVFGLGQQRTKITQTVKPSATFFLTANAKGSQVDSFAVHGEGLNMTGHTVANYQKYAAVRVHPEAHGSTVHDVHGEDIYITLRVGGDHRADPEFPAPMDSPSIERFTAYNITGQGVWCAVFGGTLKDSTISSVSGTYMKAFGTGVDTGQPPHLVYLYSPSREAGTSGIWSENLQVHNLIGYDTAGHPGAVFAPKYIRGLNASGINGRNCQGVLDLIAIEDSTIRGVTSIDDRYPHEGEASARASIAVKESSRVTIYDPSVQFAAGDHGRGIFIEANTYDVHVKDPRIVADHTVADTTQGRADVRLAGVGCSIENLDLINRGLNIESGVNVVGTGSRGRLINPSIKGSYRFGIRASANHRGALIDYDPAKVQPDYSIPDAAPLRRDTGAVVIVRDRSIGQGVPGFSDNFDRPDALALGVTEDGKRWVPNATTTKGHHAIVGGAAVATDVGGAVYEVVDAGTSSGTLTAVVREVRDSAGGLALCYVDNQNQLMLQARVSGGDRRWRLVQRLANASTTLGTAEVNSASGDVVTVVKSGAALSVRINGTEAFNVTLANFTESTLFGFYGAADSNNVTWESISLTPA